MADALHKGCDSIVTCGGIQSNHARTTAVAAAQLGLKPHLVLRWRGPIVSIVNLEDISSLILVAYLNQIQQIRGITNFNSVW